MSNDTKWPSLIVNMVKVKSSLSEVDGGFWPYHLPAVAATDEQIASAERRVEWQFPADYRAFLRHANGWRGFFQEIDLLSAEGLDVGERIDAYREMYLDVYSAQDWRALGVLADSLVVIGLSQHDENVFVIDKNSSSASTSKILWIASRVVDSWSDFESFFRSMIEYNKREIARFVK